MPSSLEIRRRIATSVRATLIHNPSAGDERPTAADLKAIVGEAGFQVRYQSTDGDWKKALQRSADLVVAAGGDGTVAQVMTQLAGSGTPIAPLPIGTANNISRSLGIVGDAREIAARWHTAVPRPFDMGLVRFSGHEERLPFVEACGGGLFARTIEHGTDQVEEASVFVGNEIDRALTLLSKLIAGARTSHWRVQVDGQDHSADCLAVEVMNIPFAGPGVPLAADARSDDGLLEVVLVRARDRRPLLDYLRRRLANDSVVLPSIETIRGRQVRIEVPPRSIRVDDDVHEVSGPFDIALWPGAVSVIAADDLSPARKPSLRSSGTSRPAPGRASGKGGSARRS
jgi:diacylglycerol kinase family enzyme